MDIVLAFLGGTVAGESEHCVGGGRPTGGANDCGEGSDEQRNLKAESEQMNVWVL